MTTVAAAQLHGVEVALSTQEKEISLGEPVEAVDVLTRNLGRFGDGEEAQMFDELLYRSLRQIAYPDISPWLMVRRPPDPEAKKQAKDIVDGANRGYMILN